MKILITGGLGFIGSHASVVLLEAGYEIVIIDNLSNSKIEVLDNINKITNKNPTFYQVDCCDLQACEKIFEKEQFAGIIHFAGLKAVGESVEKPLLYYENNIGSSVVLLKCALRYHVPRFVFSSSATVYGENEAPFYEEMPLLPTTNPYGETKKMIERILIDTAKAAPFLEVTLLRYFNPVGAHPSGLIGEDPSGIPNNLMPYITRVAKGVLKELQVFGKDYPTVDGTGVRDYIHVMDLAEGHLVALEKSRIGVSVFNLGTGKGVSVLELIHAFEKVNNVKVPYRIVPRRAGDIATCYADATKAKKEWGWQTKRTVEDMVRDAWHYEKKKK
jgi:UDP-glucose 4-epimerase